MKLIRAKANSGTVKALDKNDEELYEIPNIKIMGNALGASEGFDRDMDNQKIPDLDEKDFSEDTDKLKPQDFTQKIQYNRSN
jgi:glutamate mutase epsilon subunit